MEDMYATPPLQARTSPENRDRSQIRDVSSGADVLEAPARDNTSDAILAPMSIPLPDVRSSALTRSSSLSSLSSLASERDQPGRDYEVEKIYSFDRKVCM